MLTSDEVRERLVAAAGSVPAEPPSTTEVISAQRRSLRWTIVVTVVVCIAGATAICYGAFFAAAAVRPFNVPIVEDTTRVPKVVGMQLGDAKAKLEESKLVAETSAGCDEADPRCLVTRQLTRPGARLKPGSKVALIAPVPPVGPVRVPSVRGLSIERAKSTLAGSGLQSRQDRECQPDAKCVVVRQSPAAETLQPPGTVIELTVTSPSDPRATVPKVVGLTREKAERMIKAAGLTPDVVDKCAGLPDCLVVKQDPPPDEKVPKDTVVRIVLGGELSVPNVVGMEEANAVAALERVGLQSEKRRCPAGVACLVTEQSPPADEQVSPETIVTLTLAPKETPVVVPNVVEKSPVAAAKELGDAELVPGGAPCPSWATCIVSDQAPKGGAVAEKGDTVRLTLDYVKVKVPKVTGMSVEDARRALADRKLVAAPADLPDGTVARQSVRPGKQVEPGSTVTLTVQA